MKATLAESHMEVKMLEIEVENLQSKLKHKSFEKDVKEECSSSVEQKRMNGATEHQESDRIQSESSFDMVKKERDQIAFKLNSLSSDFEEAQRQLATSNNMIAELQDEVTRLTTSQNNHYQESEKRRETRERGEEKGGESAGQRKQLKLSMEDHETKETDTKQVNTELRMRLSEMAKQIEDEKALNALLMSDKTKAIQAMEQLRVIKSDAAKRQAIASKLISELSSKEKRYVQEIARLRSELEGAKG